MDKFEHELLIMSGMLMFGVLLLLSSGTIHDYAQQILTNCQRHDNIYCNPLHISSPIENVISIFYISTMVSLSMFVMVIE
jgi:hypothetical protein